MNKIGFTYAKLKWGCTGATDIELFNATDEDAEYLDICFNDPTATTEEVIFGFLSVSGFEPTEQQWLFIKK